MINGSNVLTLNDVLSQVTEEDIFAHMGQPVVEGQFKNPFRDDRTAKCAFSVKENIKHNLRPMIYMCDGTGYFRKTCVDCIELVTFLTGIEKRTRVYKYILDNVQHTEGTIGKAHKVTDSPIEINFTPRAWRADDYLVRHGFDPKDLIKEGVFICESYSFNTHAQPNLVQRNAYGDPKYTTVIGYLHRESGRKKLYFPFRKENKFYGNCKNEDIWGSHFVGKRLWITKSVKDYLFLKYMVGFEAVVAVQSENYLYDYHGYEENIYIYDSDAPGIKFTMNALDAGYGTRTILDPYAKDPFEMLELHGREYAVNYFKCMDF